MGRKGGGRGEKEQERCREREGIGKHSTYQQHTSFTSTLNNSWQMTRITLEENFVKLQDEAGDTQGVGR